MYRRPKSLEVILAIRTAMSEEAGYDIRTFFEMVRTGVRPADNGRTVTRVEGSHCDEPQPHAVSEPAQVDVSDQ
jgi:hypothetical protein